MKVMQDVYRECMMVKQDMYRGVREGDAARTCTEECMEVMCGTCTEACMNVMQDVYRGVHEFDARHVQRSA